MTATAQTSKGSIMTTFTIQAPAVRSALTTALAFAGNDDTLPILSAVRITSLGSDTVEFAATDRYVMSVERVNANGITSPVEFSIPSGIVKRILMILPKARKALHETSPVEFTADAEKVTIRIASDIETAITFTPYKDFVNYRKLLDQLESTEANPANTMGFTPGFLAKVCKAIDARGREPMKAHFRGETKGLVLTHGDDFKAIVMPVRIHEIEGIKAA